MSVAANAKMQSPPLYSGLYRSSTLLLGAVARHAVGFFGSVGKEHEIHSKATQE